MKNLTESLEKYLLAVYELSEIQNESVMVKDIARYLNVGGASAAEAIKTLCKRELVNYTPYKPVKLTQEGRNAVLLKMYRHNTISEFLHKVLDISKEESDKNASAIEYSMTEDVLIKFVHFMDFMSQCTCKEPKWIQGCKYSLKTGKCSKNCQNCISNQSKNCCQNK